MHRWEIRITCPQCKIDHVLMIIPAWSHMKCDVKEMFKFFSHMIKTKNPLSKDDDEA